MCIIIMCVCVWVCVCVCVCVYTYMFTTLKQPVMTAKFMYFLIQKNGKCFATDNTATSDGETINGELGRKDVIRRRSGLI